MIVKVLRSLEAYYEEDVTRDFNELSKCQDTISISQRIVNFKDKLPLTPGSTINIYSTYVFVINIT